MVEETMYLIWVACVSFRMNLRGYLAAEKEIALVQLLLTWKPR